jgi:hypothetical protein
MFIQIKEFPDYMIDENGTVVSLRNGKWKQLKNSTTVYGYHQVGLYKNQKLYSKRVHRLVLQVFYGSSEMQVNHKNGIKTDNRLANLEYCTAQHNIQHAVDMGLNVNHGEKSSRAKLSDMDAAKLLALKSSGIPYRKIAKDFNISPSQVWNIWSGNQRKHLNKEAV